jgi:hypothetical protein
MRGAPLLAYNRWNKEIEINRQTEERNKKKRKMKRVQRRKTQ